MARRFLQLGPDCVVMSPSKTERKPNEKVKTDKRDAMKIAKLFRNGDVTKVRVPPALDEAVRDLCRARTDASDDLARTKQRLDAFLLRNGFHYSGIERVERLKCQMIFLLEDWEWKPVVKAFMAFKGFQEVAAMTITSELGDLRRFDHPGKLMAFLGLVPGEETSGPKRRQGAITRCGNAHARWMLVECAQAYRKAPKINAPLTKRQEGQSKEVKNLSWRIQNRLCKRYVKLKARGKHENKVIVALARELCGFLWELQNKLLISITETDVSTTTITAKKA